MKEGTACSGEGRYGFFKLMSGMGLLSRCQVCNLQDDKRHGYCSEGVRCFMAWDSKKG